MRRFVTVGETWIHHNTPEPKQQSKRWVLPGESAPKKAKLGLPANKVMATVFWDARGVMHIDYLQKGRTINGEYYTNLLGRFNEDLKKKRPNLAKKKVLFRQDNARVHTCVVSNYAMNFSLIRRILRIKLRVTISCFRTLRNGLAERDFIPTMKSSHKQIHILRTSRNFIFGRDTKIGETLDEVNRVKR